MKRIPLTQGQFALVDDEDFVRLSAFKWCAYWESHTKSYYARRNSPTVNGKRGTIYMHREIINTPKDSIIDHVNHDTLDNRHENIRICTERQNRYNQSLRCDNTSGFKGVVWHKRYEKWYTMISVNGKRKHIGCFSTASEAAVAYDRSVIEYYGEFALTNKKLGLIP